MVIFTYKVSMAKFSNVADYEYKKKSKCSCCNYTCFSFFIISYFYLTKILLVFPAALQT